MNPTIVETSDEHIEDEEACLSLPGYYGLVSRPAHVTVNFHTLDLAPLPPPLPSTAVTNTNAQKAKNTRPGKRSRAKSGLKGAGADDAEGWNVRAVREVRLDGYGARIFQHEFDHLEGMMYTDRIVDEDKMFEMEEEEEYT